MVFSFLEPLLPYVGLGFQIFGMWIAASWLMEQAFLKVNAFYEARQPERDKERYRKSLDHFACYDEGIISGNGEHYNRLTIVEQVTKTPRKQNSRFKPVVTEARYTFLTMDESEWFWEETMEKMTAESKPYSKERVERMLARYKAGKIRHVDAAK